MELDFDDSVVRGLARYVRLVTKALELRGDCSFVHAGAPANAYIALDGRFPHFPGRDVALLWDEQHGWSAAVETPSGPDMQVVAHLGGDVLPPPGEVAVWAGRLFSDGGVTRAGNGTPGAQPTGSSPASTALATASIDRSPANAHARKRLSASSGVMPCREARTPAAVCTCWK